jgi:hypothetical protein
MTRACLGACNYTRMSVDHVVSAYEDSAIGICENSPGTHHCKCVSGFTLDPVDAATCVDVDECAVENGGCGPTTYFNCTNNLGHMPTCGAGYPACDAAVGSYRDCTGRCFPGQLDQNKTLLMGTPASVWLGDGWCDDGSELIDLNCIQWRFDDGDCLHWERDSGRYCSNNQQIPGSSTYSDLSTAKAACAAISTCTGVNDAYCVGDRFVLCNSLRSTWRVSAVGTCIYGNPDTWLANGTGR